MSNLFNSKEYSEKTPGQLLTVSSVGVFSRLLLNTAKRFPYPFAPVLSRGLGVPITAITSLIALNQAAAVLGVILAPVGDSFGYRRMMLAGMAMLITGMLIAGLLPVYGIVLVGLFLTGLAKNIFDPAIQAYVGERIPYSKRGLAIGILEFSWAGSTLIGIPILGLLISGLGWRSPFFAIGGVGLICFVLLITFIDRDDKLPESSFSLLFFWGALNQLVRQRSALGVLVFAFLSSIANDALFVVYGVWLEGQFHLTTVAIGLSTIIIGVAEFLGEGMTATLGDRLGLKRSLFLALLFSTLSYGLLPILGHSLKLAFASLFFVFLFFEFAIVTCLSLSTELIPASRATMMAGFFTTAGVGRVIGALIGWPLYLSGGIWATGLVSAAISFLTLISIAWGLREWS
jgi:MFS transporter, DHA1 family, inner membrane transport protein